MPEPLVDVRGATVRFGATSVLSGVDLCLQPGERVGLVGGSGSGKTTLARALVGLVPGGQVTANRLQVAGLDLLTARPADLRALRGGKVGLAFQDPLATLDPLQRIEPALHEVMRAHEPLARPDAHARALDLLQRVELRDPERILASHPHELSGGQRQRVGLALALAGRPRLLIADEPTSSLDPPLARAIARLLLRLTADGLGLLLVSHDMRLVRAVCQRVVVLAEGRVVEAGPVTALLDQPQHPATRTLLASAGLYDLVAASET